VVIPPAPVVGDREPSLDNAGDLGEVLLAFDFEEPEIQCIERTVGSFTHRVQAPGGARGGRGQPPCAATPLEQRVAGAAEP
jgi:hypothetical protein